MATEIKDIPVLEGEAASRFLEIIRANEREQRKVPKENYELAKEAYRHLKFQ